MPNNSAAVRLGKTGQLSVADIGSTRPTDSTTVLDAAYVGLGYVSEDGVTVTPDETTERIVAWQNAAIVRTTTTEATVTVQLTLIETRGKVKELYHKGSTVDVVSAGEWKIEVKPPTEDRRQFVLDVSDGSKNYRLDIGNGEVSDRGDITYASGDEIGYDITITCYPDDDGNLYVEYSNDTNWGYS